MEPPETHYAKTPDGLSIAYQKLGTGPTDIVLVPSFQCVDLMWEEPSYASVLRRLAGIGRLICFDSRGLGASDPVPLAELPTPESWMDDMRVVLDAVGSTSANVVCHGGARFAGLLFAATYPERVNSLVLVEAWARMLWADDYAFGYPPELLETMVQLSESAWGTGANAGVWAPSRADDAAFRRWVARFERGAWSPASFGAAIRWAVNLDLRSVLPSVRVPTLVLHRETDQLLPLEHGRYLAEHIDAARLVVMPGTDFWFFTQGADEFVDHIEEFITGAPPVRGADRALATVMFTDVVSSTGHAARLGDKKWTDVLNRHDEVISRELERHHGHKVNPTGDGMLATFDGPARAVRCAQAIIEAVRPFGIEVRAGLHTGEVELRGDDIGGIAVHIGQRVSALAAPGEVLVSRTVTDLVAGSGLEFEERGEHQLKGVPGTWTVYAVRR